MRGWWQLSSVVLVVVGCRGAAEHSSPSPALATDEAPPRSATSAGARARDPVAKPSGGSGARVPAPVGPLAGAAGAADDAGPALTEGCQTPWTILEVTPVNDIGAALERARRALDTAAAISACRGAEPERASDVCLLQVYFYGAKSFAQPDRNRHAIAIRCGSRAACEAVFEAYLPKHLELRCDGAIPHSGSVMSVAYRRPAASPP